MDVPLVIFGAKADSDRSTTHRLPEVLSFYLQYHHIEGSTEATVRFYKVEVGQFIRWLEEQGHSLDAREVGAVNVLGHLERLKQQGRAPRSIRSRLQAISTMFRWAVNWEIVPENPAGRIKPPRVPKTRKPFLKPEAFAQLLDLCPLNTMIGARRQAMLWLLVTTGVRRRELTLLELDDLDWKRGQVRVLHGKGQKERQVPFALEAQRPMLRYIKQRWDDLPCLWVTEEKKQLSYNGVKQDLERLFERAELKGEIKDVCHIFRRTFAAHAVRQGIPRPYIQAIAGWSTPHMLDHYTAAMEAEEGAIEAFRGFKPFGG